ncbi:MAG: type II toxin-antitoxin system RelE/ParE family toxin [Verrucomicrobia bacterium]|nr:type II toxin-antitoxin system RelE/ParE family toxin [Verrucomicrobiota bacterium]
MEYEIELLPAVREQLRALPKGVRYAIGSKINRLQNDLGGDVKKLQGFKNKYRLRVGDFRVLFELEGRRVVIYDIGNRKDVYE